VVQAGTRREFASDEELDRADPESQKEILRYFSRLNLPDARARNLAKALYVLSGETGRFMARAWKNGGRRTGWVPSS
jgi:hypothetical protein